MEGKSSTINNSGEGYKGKKKKVNVREGKVYITDGDPSQSRPVSTKLRPRSRFKHRKYRKKVQREGISLNLGLHKIEQEDITQNMMFLFINPTSGGNAASAFTSAGLEYLELCLEDKAYVRLWICNLMHQGSKTGFAALKEVVEFYSEKHIERPVYVIIAGGDGTVMWVTSEIVKYGIDHTKVAVAVVPYGTGNDFARTLAWNNLGYVRPYEHNLKTLRSLVTQWLASYLVYHDFWEIEFELKDTGKFSRINHQTRKKITLEDDMGNVLTNKTFNVSNYFSIGVESKIGLGFERNRTKNMLMNKMRYMIEGMKKCMFHSITPVTDVVKCLKESSEGVEGGAEIILFTTDPNCKDAPLLSQCESLMALNVPSLAGGVDAWKNSEGRLGLTNCNKQNEELRTSEMRIGDGILEWLTYRTAPSMAMDRVFKGRGRRVGQGKGPFKIEFYDLPPNKRCYFQVDGEYVQVHQPISVNLKWKRRMKVLAHPSSDLTKAVLFNYAPPLEGHRLIPYTERYPSKVKGISEVSVDSFVNPQSEEGSKYVVGSLSIPTPSALRLPSPRIHTQAAKMSRPVISDLELIADKAGILEEKDIGSND